MLVHSLEGTQRLELPVSSTTLNVWGGVPMVISEKSIRMNISASCLPVMERRGAKRTLRVHEVADGDGVAALRAHDVGVEDGVAVVPNPSVRRAHVLLAKLLDLGLDGNRSLSTERDVSAEVRGGEVGG